MGERDPSLLSLTLTLNLPVCHQRKLPVISISANQAKYLTVGTEIPTALMIYGVIVSSSLEIDHPLNVYSKEMNARGA